MPGFDELWFNRRDYFEQEACDVTMNALRRAGWKYTSQTPGSVWMWEKEIDGTTYRLTQENAASAQEHFDRKDYFKRYPDELGD